MTDYALTIGMPVWNISGRQTPGLEVALRSLGIFARSESIELILIDNASTVQYSTAIPQTTTKITKRVIHNDRNLGWVKASNQILAHATGEYICIVNSDVLCSTPGWDVLLTMTAGREAIAFPNPKGHNKESLEWFPPGYCFLAHRDTFDKLGAFDERFFNFYADSDYWVRARRSDVPLCARADVDIANDRQATGHGLTHVEAHRQNLLPANDFHLDRIKFEKKYLSEHMTGQPLLYKGMLSIIEERSAA